MELRHLIEIIFLILCIFTIIAIFLFIARKKNINSNYDKIIKDLNNQKEQNLKALNKGNKEIDKIERKILDCKKELKIKYYL